MEDRLEIFFKCFVREKKIDDETINITKEIHFILLFRNCVLI